MDPLPLCEDDLADPGVLEPHRVVPRRVRLPEAAVLCFFPEVVAAVPAVRTVHLSSELGPWPVHEIERDGRRLAVIQPGVGAPLSAIFLEELIALGVRAAVAVGGAGSLVPELTVGHAVVVDSALRDEGTSFHYLPAGRVVEADPAGVAALTGTLDAADVPYVTARAWTTDGVFRETRGRVARRVAEGCAVVDMEASALIAVARYRGIRLAHLLFAGDSLAGEEWEHRGWTTAAEIRAALFELAADAALRLVPPAHRGS
ncbi:nucleoside phosphorylase [Pseudonocardia halophobica]|uniref:nucleoside phosphorylase n=1 Tax=Pseudonocardia halophobica TaxID=29401 RepID=UPI003D8B1CA2